MSRRTSRFIVLLPTRRGMPWRVHIGICGLAVHHESRHLERERKPTGRAMVGYRALLQALCGRLVREAERKPC